MAIQALIVISSVILGILGGVHFYYVYATKHFEAFDEYTTLGMKNTSPKLTKKTSMWSAWLGFNYSHSFGVLWVPMTYVYLAIFQFQVLQNSLWLMFMLPGMCLVYVVLSKRYWFSIPYYGSVVALVCAFLACVLNFGA